MASGQTIFNQYSNRILWNISKFYNANDNIISFLMLLLLEVAELLISNGADVGAKNKQGNMPHDLAGTSERKFEEKKIFSVLFFWYLIECFLPCS